MTVVSSAVSSGRFKPTPPAKGSFPFDRLGYCKELVEKYMACLKSNKGNIEQCRELSKGYLECRMEHNLMAEDRWENLGFKEQDKKA